MCTVYATNCYGLTEDPVVLCTSGVVTPFTTSTKCTPYRCGSVVFLVSPSISPIQGGSRTALLSSKSVLSARLTLLHSGPMSILTRLSTNFSDILCGPSPIQGQVTTITFELHSSMPDIHLHRHTRPYKLYKSRQSRYQLPRHPTS